MLKQDKENDKKECTGGNGERETRAKERRARHLNRDGELHRM